ncbi:MAG: hypothetical protein OXF79_02705 [Chloroflexi bacterium]|nr:hypothetical protein [Chloroflexota bacterium]
MKRTVGTAIRALPGTTAPRVTRKAMWKANTRASSEYFLHLASSALSLSNALRSVERNFEAEFLSATRQASVELRKLLLAGRNSLLKRCVERPKLHGFVSPASLAGDAYGFESNLSGQARIESKTGDYVRQLGNFNLHVGIVVEPLYGMSFDSATNQWHCKDPFRQHGPPNLKLEAWLRQPVLQINDETYTLRTVLTDVANTQGAHVDLRPDSVPSRIGEHFASVYTNILVLFVAQYVNMVISVEVDHIRSSLGRKLRKVHPDMSLWKKRYEEFSLPVQSGLELHGTISSSSGTTRIRAPGASARKPIPAP